MCLPAQLTSVRITPVFSVSEVPSPSVQLEMEEGARLGWNPRVTLVYGDTFEGEYAVFEWKHPLYARRGQWAQARWKYSVVHTL